MFEHQSISEVSTHLKTNEKTGLSEAEAVKRLEEYGSNELKESGRKNIVERFFEQLQDPLIYVLLAASAISLLLHEVSDAIIIVVVVLGNACMGILQEGKAQKALDSLKKLTSPHAFVIRDGKKMEIPASQLVIGDLVDLEAGAQIPADLRLTMVKNLKVEESALTGESLPVEKESGFLSSLCRLGDNKEIPLGDRRNMAYMSTIVTYGRGQGIVTATGMETEIGKIAALISESNEEITPLQKRLGDLGKLLSFLALGICAILFLIALLQQRNLFEMLLTAISLAVAAVPEGLPAIVTICLALSVTKMVRVNTIVRRLPSVETLGSVSVVCSDKTGTLTQNKMTVTHCYANGRIFAYADSQENEYAHSPENRMKESLSNEVKQNEHQELLYGMSLCNDAVLTCDSRMGDPTELALLDFAQDFGIHREALEQEFPRISELAFDSGRKMMSTLHKKRANVSSSQQYTKGAPEVVLKKCNSLLLNDKKVPLTPAHRLEIQNAMQEMSEQALRTLAFAIRDGQNSPIEEDLVFVGMVGMKDPARPEAKEAVLKFKDAGVGTVMITGDHVDTAYAIAKQLEIAKNPEDCMTGEEIQNLQQEEFQRRLKHVRVFARVTPEHKVRIVKGFQEKGSIVAMTGDGVNDAPSLKAADVGIAMGKNGTDVAKQASDVILTDDNFATIEKAMEEGRGVYENIKKSVVFLLSSNLGEIVTMFVAVLCGLASPLRSSHILWVNLITDSLPALALGIDKNDGDSLMQRPPRKAGESLFAHGGLACTCFYGVLIAVLSLTAFLSLPYGLLKESGEAINLGNMALLLQQDEILMRAQTYAFTVLGMSQLFHAIGMRDVYTSVFRMNYKDSKLMILAFFVGFFLQVLVTEWGFLISAFGTTHLSLGEWIRLMVLAAFPLLAHEIFVLLSNKNIG